MRSGLALLCAVVLTACSSGDAAPDPTPPSESPSPTAEARTYRDRDMLAALPRPGDDFHGRRITHECRAFTAKCGGSAGLTATKPPNEAVDLLGLNLSKRPESLAKLRRTCVEGPYRQPLKRGEGTSYTPGERGSRKPIPLSREGWEGFGCQKRLRYLHPDGARTRRTAVIVLGLTNGVYLISVVAPGQRLARTVMTEYVDRLEAGSTG